MTNNLRSGELFCSKCEPGFYCSYDICTPCSLSSYPILNLKSCQKCPDGISSREISSSCDLIVPGEAYKSLNAISSTEQLKFSRKLSQIDSTDQTIIIAVVCGCIGLSLLIAGILRIRSYYYSSIREKPRVQKKSAGWIQINPQHVSITREQNEVVPSDPDPFLLKGQPILKRLSSSDRTSKSSSLSLFGKTNSSQSDSPSSHRPESQQTQSSSQEWGSPLLERDGEEYIATKYVKSAGHRVRIAPSLQSNQVHLLKPTELLRVIEVITIDKCEWGKVHPVMFPEGFQGCNIALDGWTMLADRRRKGLEVVYWEKASTI